MSGLVDWSDRIWITGPRWLGLRVPALRGIAGDGHVVSTLPVAGVLLPVVALGFGLVAGGFRLGYVDVYTESVLLMGLLVGLGCFSSQLGALALLGFVVGDVVSTRPVLSYEAAFSTDFWFTGVLGEGLLAHLVHIRLPRLVTYLLLAAVVVVLPRAARGAVASVGRGRRMPAALAWVLVSGLVLVIAWLGVSAWVAGGPTLVRPVFVWGSPSGAPTAEAVQPLQAEGTLVVAAALAGTMVRQLWLGAAMFLGPVRERLAAAEATPPPAAAARPARRSHPLPAALLTATLATLTLAGILEHPLVWGVAFGVFFVVRLLRFDQVRFPALDAWRRVANLAPAWARLIGLWLLSRLVVGAVDNELIGSYTALAVVVLVSVFVVFLIFPGEPGRGPGRTERAVETAPPSGPGTAATAPAGSP
jgi:hypothetical protein